MRVGGDIFYNPASTVGIKFGHVGVYSSQTRIVEAPGVKQRSRETDIRNVSVYKTSQLLYVKISESKRKAAGRYAKNKLLNKPYNIYFATNKNPYGKNMNCSQLVWAAYKNSAKVDLDGNGGPGVYPNDIVKSTKTKTWRTY